MRQRKLPVDLSSLWTNPHLQYTLRFLDTSENAQRLLTKRIKECAPQQRLRNKSLPEITDILTEINPIIFSESHMFNERYNRLPENSYKRFNMNHSYSIQGYYFKELCQSLYRTICTVKPLTHTELCHVANLTFRNWSKVTDFINQHYHEPFVENQETVVEELSLEELTRARINTEEHNSNGPRFNASFEEADDNESGEEQDLDEEESLQMTRITDSIQFPFSDSVRNNPLTMTELRIATENLMRPTNIDQDIEETIINNQQ